MRIDPADGRGTLRAGRSWRGLGRGWLAALLVLAATGVRRPRCRRAGA
jgi:hypothetical protein